jgi:hypothetical protein
MPSEVLSQTDVRNRFSEVTESLRRRSCAEVHFGNRGADELAIVRSEDLEILKRLAQKAASSEAATVSTSDPWAGLKSAIRASAASAPNARRRTLSRDFDDDEAGAPTWDTMVRLAGNGPTAPEFTRRRKQR